MATGWAEKATEEAVGSAARGWAAVVAVMGTAEGAKATLRLHKSRL